MKQSYQDRVIELIQDNSASQWFKWAMTSLDRRDVIDALNDLELLTELQMQRFEEAKLKWTSKA
jgi:hypothetical protein